MIKFYKNKDEKFADSYSMDVRINGKFDCYSFSDNPFSPQGVNSFLGTIEEPRHAGEFEIDFDDMPEKVQKAIVERLMPIPM